MHPRSAARRHTLVPSEGIVQARVIHLRFTANRINPPASTDVYMLTAMFIYNVEFGTHRSKGQPREVSSHHRLPSGNAYWTFECHQGFLENVKEGRETACVYHRNIWTLPQDLHTPPADSSLAAYLEDSPFTSTGRTNTLPTLRLTQLTVQVPPQSELSDDRK